MERELIIQKLRQAADSGLLSETLTNTLDEAAKFVERETAEVEIEYSDIGYWYMCGECRNCVFTGHKYCEECGRRLIWE